MNNPLVSIVMPIYNAENYLKECLNSVINQTLKEIEIICVDDGSTDNSLNIAQDFAIKDSRIKIISKHNSGYGHSMNVGIKSASGKYIGIVEPDDFVDKKMFSLLYKTAIKYDCDIVKSDFFEFSTTSQKYVMTPTHYKYYNKVLNSCNNPEIFNFKMNTWTGIYRKSFLEKYNINHNETAGAAFQDNGFWFQTLALAEKIIFISRAFYHYRQDNPNSSINNPEKVFCMCEEYDFIEQFLTRYPKIKKRLYGWFWLKKFHNYLYTYSRIADKHKPLFLNRFSYEFKEANNKNTLDKSLFDKNNLSLLIQIIDNPKEFAQNFNKSLLNKFSPIKTNKFKKLLIYIKLFGIQNTLKIIKQKTE